TFALKDTDPDYVPLFMGNYLIGGSSTSWLYKRVRDKEGYSYSVGSQLDTSARDPYSLFLVTAEYNPIYTEKVDKAVLEELTKALKDGVSATELKEGQKSSLQELKVSSASDNALAGYLREGLELGRTFAYYADLEKKIAALTAKEVNAALARHLAVDRLVIVRAGDFNKKAKEK